MTRKRAKTIRIIEPPPSAKKEDVRFVEIVEPPPPSSTNEIKSIESVKPPPPSKKGEVTYIELVEPPPTSRKHKRKVLKVVAVPGHILRSLHGNRVVRGQVSETEAEKLRAIPDADDLTRLVLRFLVDHSDRGFTATEIGNAVEEVGRNKVRLLLTGLGVEYRRHGKVLFSINPPRKQTTHTIEILET